MSVMIPASTGIYELSYRCINKSRLRSYGDYADYRGKGEKKRTTCLWDDVGKKSAESLEVVGGTASGFAEIANGREDGFLHTGRGRQMERSKTTELAKTARSPLAVLCTRLEARYKAKDVNLEQHCAVTCDHSSSQRLQNVLAHY